MLSVASSECSGGRCCSLFVHGKEDVVMHILLFAVEEVKEVESWRGVSRFWDDLIRSNHHYSQVLWKELYWKDFVVKQLEKQWIEFRGGDFDQDGDGKNNYLKFNSDEQLSEFNHIWKRRDLDWRFLYLKRDIFLGFYRVNEGEEWIQSMKNHWRRGLSESDRLNLAMLYYEIEGSKYIALEMEQSIVNLLRHRKNGSTTQSPITPGGGGGVEKSITPNSTTLRNYHAS